MRNVMLPHNWASVWALLAAAHNYIDALERAPCWETE